MTTGMTATSDRLWHQIRAEAQRAIAADPVFGRSLVDAVLAHDGLAQALADLIGRRLGNDAIGQQRFMALSRDAFRDAPLLIDAASRDLQAIARRDPAISGLLAPLLHFKGFVALQAWRVSNWLWDHHQRDTALLFQNEASNLLQVSIHPSASIGASVYLDHATGIVIGADVAIGEDVTILQNVSISRSPALPPRSPRIGRAVFIGAGATILGDVRVGDFARIGADSVVVHDVPGGCTAVGNPARLTNCPEPASAA